VGSLFELLKISQDLVPIALTAMKRHSQNDIMYDPTKAENITEQELRDADVVFDWLGLPFNTMVTMEDFKQTMC